MGISLHNLGDGRKNLYAAEPLLPQAIIHRANPVVGGAGHGDDCLIPILKAQHRNGSVYGPQYRNPIDFCTYQIGIVIKEGHHPAKNLLAGNLLRNHLTCKASSNYVQLLSSLPCHTTSHRQHFYY